MTLVKNTLKAAILVAMNKQMAKTDPSDDPLIARQEFAEDLATAIDSFVKSITVNPGIIVNVDPNSGVGATSGPGTVS